VTAAEFIARIVEGAVALPVDLQSRVKQARFMRDSSGDRVIILIFFKELIMQIKDELKKLIGKPCWFNEGILEIREKSDGEIVAIEEDNLIIKNILFEHLSKIPLFAISGIKRKDLGSKNIKKETMTQIRLRELEPFNVPPVNDQQAALFMRNLTGNETFEFDGDQRPSAMMIYYLEYNYPEITSASAELLSTDIDTFIAACESGKHPTIEDALKEYGVGHIQIEYGGKLKETIIHTESEKS
jgi:hypothetical protein